MSAYRLYLASGLTSRFEPPYEFEAVDDKDAVAKGELARSKRTAELWHRGRLVKQWTAPSPITASVSQPKAPTT
jgi:hypothetical protein